MLSLALVLGLGMPGPSAWAARSARSAKKAGKAKARKGPQPKLLLPAEDAEIEPGKRVTFTWKVAAKLVRLEVARDEEFTDKVVDRPVKGRYAVLPIDAGTYYWRVTAPRGGPSDPRRLTVGAEPAPEPLAEAPSEAQAQAEPMTTGGLGLDLTGATTPSDTSTAAPSDTAALASAAETPVAAPVTSEPPTPVVAEAERPSSSSQRGNQKRWSLFVGGSAALGSTAPNSMTTLRYEASVAFRIANPFELSLAVGGSSLQVLGTRDATWPYYTWSGQYYFDLGARYRLVRFDGGALFGLVSGRLAFFTAAQDQLGFLVDRSPFSAGAGIAFRFRAGLPLELGLRGNVLTGKSLGGEAELGLRVMVF
ncbi:MAG TPA: hypothetical protein VFZ09_21605 [Archangium sp.]|uniref:hypothetical protein n=1 Tax=Archangium sp. TaxID=1872627 RepID=UPI002E32307C|nr:hypothetical protein [Archangium sp.]HEX5748851.1 hypothetical protein [Archangium sp.]